MERLERERVVDSSIIDVSEGLWETRMNPSINAAVADHH
jgi:hypothetical protein